MAALMATLALSGESTCIVTGTTCESAGEVF